MRDPDPPYVVLPIRFYFMPKVGAAMVTAAAGTLSVMSLLALWS
jgi:hypothetical protein